MRRGKWTGNGPCRRCAVQREHCHTKLMNLTEAFVSANIPLHTLDHPAMKKTHRLQSKEHGTNLRCSPAEKIQPAWPLWSVKRNWKQSPCARPSLLWVMRLPRWEIGTMCSEYPYSDLFKVWQKLWDIVAGTHHDKLWSLTAEISRNPVTTGLKDNSHIWKAN